MLDYRSVLQMKTSSFCDLTRLLFAFVSYWPFPKVGNPPENCCSVTHPRGLSRKQPKVCENSDISLWFSAQIWCFFVNKKTSSPRKTHQTSRAELREKISNNCTNGLLNRYPTCVGGRDQWWATNLLTKRVSMCKWMNRIRNVLPKTSNQHSTWKRMVGRRSFPSGAIGAISGLLLLVSRRVIEKFTPVGSYETTSDLRIHDSNRYLSVDEPDKHIKKKTPSYQVIQFVTFLYPIWRSPQSPGWWGPKV